jgi:uncharacterized protein YacL
MTIISLPFIRAFFLLISILFLTTYVISINGASFGSITIGIIAGLLLGSVLIGIEMLLKRINLRTFNLIILGLFFGYLMGSAIMLLINTLLNVSPISLTPETMSLTKIIVYLFSIYFGTTMAIRASDEISLSIPFVKFQPTDQKKKDLLCDLSALSDARVIDLATSGLLDNHLIIPRFLVKELNNMNENGDEAAKAKARRSLEALKKLESLPTLNLRYSDTDFVENKESLPKLFHLARMLDASILTADLNRIQQSTSEGIRIINIHSLSNALKPITQNGELLNIKIQRYGKEPRQGVGYLDDGTMVVVNGGAEYIGESIKAQVLSVKHTSSGRMIFCNTTEEHLASMNEMSLLSSNEMDNGSKNYFTL